MVHPIRVSATLDTVIRELRQTGEYAETGTLPLVATYRDDADGTVRLVFGADGEEP